MTQSIAQERQRLLDRLAEIEEERSHIEYALQVLDRVAFPPGSENTDDEAEEDEGVDGSKAVESFSRPYTNAVAAAQIFAAKAAIDRFSADPGFARALRQVQSLNLSNMNRLAAVAASAASHVPKSRPRQVGAATHHYALRALESFDHAERVEDIVEKMIDLGWVSEAQNPIESVRAALSRAVKDGSVARPAYGMYAIAPGADEPEDDRDTPSNGGQEYLAIDPATDALGLI